MISQDFPYIHHHVWASVATCGCARQLKQLACNVANAGTTLHLGTCRHKVPKEGGSMHKELFLLTQKQSQIRFWMILIDVASSCYLSGTTESHIPREEMEYDHVRIELYPSKIQLQQSATSWEVEISSLYENMVLYEYDVMKILRWKLNNSRTK